ncbi:MAG: hypothetical protein ACXADB_08620, partial [Candidatus Hermodarchaeia archaeon]
VLLISGCLPVDDGGEDNHLPKDQVRAPAYLGEMQIFIMESYPVQISLYIQGELPTPCHTFSYSITDPNEKLEIHVDAFSLVEDEAVCVQMVQPFEENIPIPMAGQADGNYSVWVNGEKVGEFSYPA